jgi:hypothetical protein
MCVVNILYIIKIKSLPNYQVYYIISDTQEGVLKVLHQCTNGQLFYLNVYAVSSTTSRLWGK